jgi:Uri superfamily endonuclease
LSGLVRLIETELLAAGIHALSAGPNEIDTIGSRKGAYLLALAMPRALDLEAIRRIPQRIPAGAYVYAGSAYGPGGLSARLGRHMRPAKAVHWHIDRLTVQAGHMAALAVPEGDECRLVEALLGTGWFEVAVPGFGSTDCRSCEGHLLAARPSGS